MLYGNNKVKIPQIETIFPVTPEHIMLAGMNKEAITPYYPFTL